MDTARSDSASEGLITGARGPDLLARLDVWLASARSDEAAAERRRLVGMRSQADEETSLVDLLVDLGERGSPVVVTDSSGTSHRGPVTLVGSDSVVVRGHAGETIIAMRAIVGLRTQSESGGSERRSVASTADMRTLCALLSEDRPRVRVCPVGGDAVIGRLRGVGLDVVRLRLDATRPGHTAETAFVPVGALVHLVALDDR